MKLTLGYLRIERGEDETATTIAILLQVKALPNFLSSLFLGIKVDTIVGVLSLIVFQIKCYVVIMKT